MLEDQSVEEIIHNINQRQISIKEVMEYYLDRIEKFNPDFHQAVSTIKDASKENDIVSEVVQQGYSLNGRVIKPALVVVIKNQ